MLSFVGFYISIGGGGGRVKVNQLRGQGYGFLLFLLFKYFILELFRQCRVFCFSILQIWSKMTWHNIHDDSSNSHNENVEMAMELAKQKAKYVQKGIYPSQPKFRLTQLTPSRCLIFRVQRSKYITVFKFLVFKQEL